MRNTRWIRDGRINNGINPANFTSVCILQRTPASFRSFSSVSFPKGVDRSCNPERRDALRWDHWNCVSSGQVVLRDSLKSILHAGYSRLSPFIGDYSSAFRKKERHDALERIENIRYCRRYPKTGFVILDLFPLFPLVTRISLSKRENYRVYLISLEISFLGLNVTCEIK